MDKNLFTRPVLTVQEAAEVLRVSRDVAYEAVRRGEIPSVRIGRRIVVPTAALKRLLGMETTEAPPKEGGPASERPTPGHLAKSPAQVWTADG